MTKKKEVKKSINLTEKGRFAFMHYENAQRVAMALALALALANKYLNLYK